MYYDVTELDRNQLDALKMAYLCDSYEAKGEEPSYYELVESLSIPDEVIFAEYAGICFTPGDFFT